MPAGPDFRYTNFSGGRGFRILPTHTFRVAVTVAFYLHKLFGWPGFCILSTQTVGAMLMKIPFCVDKCILRRTARGNVDENSCLMSVKIFCVGLLGAMLMKMVVLRR